MAHRATTVKRLLCLVSLEVKGDKYAYEAEITIRTALTEKLEKCGIMEMKRRGKDTEL